MCVRGVPKVKERVMVPQKTKQLRDGASATVRKHYTVPQKTKHFPTVKEFERGAFALISGILS